MEKRFLNKPGEFDYDFKNDILLFKVKEREYSHSIELNRLVIDIDKENFVVAIQIIGASEMFNLSKEELRRIKDFHMKCNVENRVIEINVGFNILFRNKLIEKNPIIFERVKEDIPNSRILCQI